MEQKNHPMAHRQNGVEHKPVFMPRVNSDNLVKTDMVRFERHVGFATRQKKKSINDMHQVIRKNTVLTMFWNSLVNLAIS